MAMMDKSWLNLEQIKQHSLDMRQFIDFRESRLPNGMRIIDAYNSSGLTFTLLPDRGMDIWTADYNGMPLTWIAPASPHPPDYGQSWLSLFNGGLLTTCGLTHVGPPEDGRDIHGNYTRLRATIKGIREFSDIDEDNNYHLQLESEINQSTLFGEQLRLQREFSISLGDPKIQIVDRVTNMGDEPVPFMLLYHCNIGYPMIREGTEFLVASDVYPRDADARAGLKTWNHYDSASVAYREQVFFHHVKKKHPESIFAEVALLNQEQGLKFKWSTQNMPYHTQWKNTRKGIYVCGVEPGNCIPEGQNAAKKSGRLVMLQAGESKDFVLSIEIINGIEHIQQCRENIQALMKEGAAVRGCNLSAYQQYQAK